VTDFLTKAIKFFVAILLLPLFVPIYKSIWIHARALNERTLFFENPLSLILGGIIVWIFFALLFHLPSSIYIFAHEFTHALFAKLCGAKIKKISVKKDSGYVIADKTNFLIVLAPYLFPFYAMLLALVAVLVSLFVPFKTFDILVWVSLGTCLGYHWWMTGLMLGTRQTDFSSQGYFFSFVLILLVNGTLFLLLFLLLPTPQHFLERVHSLGLSFLDSYKMLFDWLFTGIKKITRLHLFTEFRA
jgi:hypothetical protein